MAEHDEEFPAPADCVSAPFDGADYIRSVEDIALQLQMSLEEDSPRLIGLNIAQCWRGFCRNIDPDAAARHPELAAALVPHAPVDVALLGPLLRAVGLRLAPVAAAAE